MKNLNEMAQDECRACSNRRGNKETATRGVYTCAKCGAIFGHCYLGDSYAFVSGFMTTRNVPAEEQRYFDFTVLGSTGIGRRHGWYEPASGLMTQIG